MTSADIKMFREAMQSTQVASRVFAVKQLGLDLLLRGDGVAALLGEVIHNDENEECRYEAIGRIVRLLFDLEQRPEDLTSDDFEKLNLFFITLRRPLARDTKTNAHSAIIGIKTILRIKAGSAELRDSAHTLKYDRDHLKSCKNRFSLSPQEWYFSAMSIFEKAVSGSSLNETFSGEVQEAIDTVEEMLEKIKS